MKLNISKSYGDKVVLNNLELEVGKGEITCILGESGVGKTTILNIVGGSVPYEGSIEDAPKSVSYVFQTDRLIPSLSVYKNLDYVLRGVTPSAEERRERIKDMLNKVGLTADADTLSGKLSGGMAQRVSIARAFLYPAEMLLMDEPFKELDVALKKRLTDLFVELWREEKRTVLYVTHDVDEALLLADSINILHDGRIAETFRIAMSQKDLTSPTLIEVRNKIYGHFFAERV